MKTILNLIGIAALMWVCSEPSGPLGWSWIAGEIIGMAVCAVSFKSAAALGKKTTKNNS